MVCAVFEEKSKEEAIYHPRVCTSLEAVLERKRKWVLNKRTLRSIQFYLCLRSGTMTARSELQHCEVVSLAVFSVTEPVGICYSCSQKSNTHCSIQKRCGVMGKGPFLGGGACGCSFRCRDIGVLSDALFDSLQHIFMSPHMSESEHAPIPPPQPNGLLYSIWYDFFTRRNIIRVIFNTKVWWLPAVKILSQVSEQRELLKDDMLSLFSSAVDCRGGSDRLGFI